MPSINAFRLPLAALLGALALSGCMHRPSPVAGASRLDALAYGPPPAGAQPVPVRRHAVPRFSDGALAALRNSFAAVPRPASVRRGPPPAIAARTAPSATGAMAARPHDAAYRLDAGDRLRIVVYGQEGLTNTYTVGADGTVTMPLIGTVAARGRTPSELAAAIRAQLRHGFIRDPYVAAEVETYRPFFILGEVAAPGQYPYVPNMTAESAVAIAGGYSPRARRDHVTLSHATARGSVRAVVPPTTPIRPGDTITVDERWF